MKVGFKLLDIFFLALSFAVTLGTVGGIIFLIYKLATKNQTVSPRKAFIIMPIIILLISAAAFILNIGWYRVALTIFLIVPLHTLVFLFTMFYSSDCIPKKRSILILTIINYILHPLTYMLLPDSADIGESYMFFTLIKNETICRAALPIAILCLISSVILIILQLIISLSLKRKAKKPPQENMPQKT